MGQQGAAYSTLLNPKELGNRFEVTWCQIRYLMSCYFLKLFWGIKAPLKVYGSVETHHTLRRKDLDIGLRWRDAHSVRISWWPPCCSVTAVNFLKSTRHKQTSNTVQDNSDDERWEIFWHLLSTDICSTVCVFASRRDFPYAGCLFFRFCRVSLKSSALNGAGERRFLVTLHPSLHLTRII